MLYVISISWNVTCWFRPIISCTASRFVESQTWMNDVYEIYHYLSIYLSIKERQTKLDKPVLFDVNVLGVKLLGKLLNTWLEVSNFAATQRWQHGKCPIAQNFRAGLLLIQKKTLKIRYNIYAKWWIKTWNGIIFSVPVNH